jgi:hypothetical protein
MKKPTYSLVVAATFAFCSFANANITSTDFWNTDNNMQNCQWSYPLKGGVPSASMLGYQYGVAGITGNVGTDTTTDPILYRGDDIFNDTTNAWSDYHLTITLATNFTISAVQLFTADWYFTQGGLVQNGNQYTEALDFYANAPADAIQLGSDLNFSYKLTFSGLTQYTITETLAPSYVPEPGSVALATLGGLVFGGMMLRKRTR